MLKLSSARSSSGFTLAMAGAPRSTEGTIRGPKVGDTPSLLCFAFFYFSKQRTQQSTGTSSLQPFL